MSRPERAQTRPATRFIIMTVLTVGWYSGLLRLLYVGGAIPAASWVVFGAGAVCATVCAVPALRVFTRRGDRDAGLAGIEIATLTLAVCYLWWPVGVTEVG